MTDGQFSQPASICLAPGGLCFPATAGEPILVAGQRAGFAFPQACRNGNCFRCEGRLLAGTVQHLRTREKASGSTEAAPLVLPCIVTALGDCVLAVEGVYGPGELPVQTVAAQVIAVAALNHNVVRVQLRLPAGKKATRLAGQYLEIVDGDNSFAFSIASAPASGRDIELHVRYGDDNPSSLAVLALLRSTPVVTLRLPMGDCTLVSEPRLPLLLIAGSTGFAQVKAFVEHAIAQRWTVPINIYWGVRTRSDLYLPDLPPEWARDHANIRFTAVISDAQAVADTHAESSAVSSARGVLVHEAALKDLTEPDATLAYVCGSPAMVYAVQDALTARGVPVERIFSDVFAWAPRPA